MCSVFGDEERWEREGRMVLFRQANTVLATWSPAAAGTSLWENLNELNLGWKIETGNTNFKTSGELNVI